MLKKILGLQEPDTSKWEKVAKLKPEDVTKRRNLDADEANLRGEVDVLVAKIHALKAKSNAAGTEWWEYMHRNYSLPRQRSYTISDDGYVLMEPKESSDGHS